MALRMSTNKGATSARYLLDQPQERLAEASGVSLLTISRLEAADAGPAGRKDTAGKIVAALEAAGDDFTNGDQPGVRLSKGQGGE